MSGIYYILSKIHNTNTLIHTCYVIRIHNIQMIYNNLNIGTSGIHTFTYIYK